MAWMYILECCDNSYYVGSTKDLKRRMSQHQDGIGSNYTSKREALINGTPELLPALAKKVFDRSKIDKVNLVDGELGG